MVLCACALGVMARGVYAQSHHEREHERESLLDQAASAAERHNHARALDAATRAGAIRMTPAVRRFIAEENLELNHLAASLRAARLCVRDAETDLMSAHRADVLRDCRAMVERLERRVGYVVVRLPSNTLPGVQVRVQGDDVPRAQWGEALPVDPGAVEVVAELGELREGLRLQVSPGLTRIWEVSLSAPPPPRPHVTPVAAQPPVARAPTPPIAPAPPPRASEGPGAGPWIVAGVGVALLGGALVTLTQYDALRAEQLQHCTENLTAGTRDCRDARGIDVSDQRDTLRGVNNALFFGGLAALAGGVVWYVVARVQHRERSHAPLHVGVAPSSTGATLVLGAAF